MSTTRALFSNANENFSSDACLYTDALNLSSNEDRMSRKFISGFGVNPVLVHDSASDRLDDADDVFDIENS